MSHKTLYIDADEEITSIIDRVRKSAAGEIIIVAPKQSLLLQSLVNLKLLKKETDRRSKKVIIVTQDKTGKKLIEKAGIVVQNRFDDSLQEYEDQAYISKKEKDIHEYDDILDDIEKKDEELEVGSDKYFDEPLPKTNEKKEINENIGQISFVEKSIPERSQKKSLQKKNIAKRKDDEAKEESRVKMSDIIAGPKQKTKKSQKITAPKIENEKRIVPKTSGFYANTEFGSKADKKTDIFFSETQAPTAASSRRDKKIMKTERIRGKSSRYFFIFSMAIFGIAIFLGMRFLLPKATIIIHLNYQNEAISETLEANAGAAKIDSEKKIIPAVKEQQIVEKTGEFSATGSQALPGQPKENNGKAKGSVVIYNEFSSENQPLVVTTRLETEDGKIFRITKNTIVPGMTKLGSENKPGAIEVEVVADNPGEEYNIDPAEFKIPGFKGGPKYEKFFAKSSKAMSGGAKSGPLSVSSQDIVKAKEKLFAEAKEEALSQLKKRLPAERKFFDEGAIAEIVSAESSVSPGTQAEKFSYTVKVSARVLAFSEDDVKGLLKTKAEKEGRKAQAVYFEKPLNYLLIESPKDENFVKCETKTDIRIAAEPDLANFKKGSLGKDYTELETLIKSYPSIQKADVNFWPFYVKRIPMNEKRVRIEIERPSS